MHYEKIHLGDEDIYAYLLVKKENFTILDGNKLAQRYFCVSEDCCDTEGNIFATECPHLQEIFTDEHLSSFRALTYPQSVSLSNIPLHTHLRTEILCDVEVSLVDTEESILFLVIKESNLQKSSELKDLIDFDQNSIIVLENLPDLPVQYGNTRFFHCINMSEEEFTAEKQRSFLSFLPQEKQESFRLGISHRLGHQEFCDVDVELTFDGQFYHLFRLNVYHSSYDGKLYGVLISVKRQSELMKKIEYDQQYFDIMQRFSKDLLFRIDIKKRTLVHRGDISKFMDLQPEVIGFPEAIRDIRWVHPDDLEGYIAFSYRLIHGMDSTFEPRFLFGNGNYEKYRLQGSVLFDEEGIPVQVVGKASISRNMWILRRKQTTTR